MTHGKVSIEELPEGGYEARIGNEVQEFTSGARWSKLGAMVELVRCVFHSYLEATYRAGAK